MASFQEESVPHLPLLSFRHPLILHHELVKEQFWTPDCGTRVSSLARKWFACYQSPSAWIPSSLKGPAPLMNTDTLY